MVLLAASAFCVAGCDEASSAAADRKALPAAARVLDAHAAMMRERWGEGYTVLTEPPFVIVGDQAPTTVQRHAERTVRWAVAKLKEEYFARDPDHIITIYLLGDRASYEAHAERLTGREPGTPFGFYAPGRRVMVMNISTGGGTLVHEIVHPFVAANFPRCPAWFNEGLGSLYEQSAERDGRIIGKTNWRLGGLQEAIANDALPSFATLTATNVDTFYGEGAGLRYAHARYLCYYLQEHGLLRDYYHAFAENHADDPTGYQTLIRVLGAEGQGMAAFDARWRRWVMTLRFP